MDLCCTWAGDELFGTGFRLIANLAATGKEPAQWIAKTSSFDSEGSVWIGESFGDGVPMRVEELGDSEASLLSCSCSWCQHYFPTQEGS